MLRRLSVGVLGLLLAGLGSAASSDEPPAATPLGFAPGAASAFAPFEARALAMPTPDQARAWLRTLTEEPHAAGTPADSRTALFVRDRLREWGWKVEIAEYEVLLNYPVQERDGSFVAPTLRLTRPHARVLPVAEPAVAGDKDSASRDAFPAFHGYGVSGQVAGQVVYANYGRPEDFAALERLGVEVRDKIVLVRYGELFRGLKVRNAQKRGAKGALIYSDPADDGYGRGDIYPHGPYRSSGSLQRGSVQFLSLGPGDPSTPFGPSVKGAKRLPIDGARGFPTVNVEAWERETGLKRDDYFATIPSLPIGYAAARPILDALAGPNVPAAWQGGLPLPYHVGPGPAEVEFATRSEYQVRPVWNVIATLEGSAEPDRWILVGNHRDAWVYGAVDPGSGTAATLEMCRALGAAVKAGWKPRRTLVYASWDAEEYGLVGSTEWADEHARELDDKAVLMLNVDSAVAGPDLDIDGVPSLRELVLDAAGAVRDARSGNSLRAVWTAHRRAEWARRDALDLPDPLWGDAGSPPVGARFRPHLNWLGSGSDYTAFVDHLGIPALDVGFRGKYGVYHSIYDDFTWMEKFGDPEFLTHAAAARLYTAVAMRAAGADVVPLRFLPYGAALREHVDDLRRLAVRRAREKTRGADDRPPDEFEGLRPLVAAVRAFQTAAATLAQAVNDALMRVERALLLPNGLPGRPWFKHAVYAPGLTTGYASWPLPGVRQALLDDDPALLKTQLPALVDRVHAATAAMQQAADEAAR
jgi:N-acetylated-alpha-linked acidic dipeptidase